MDHTQKDIEFHTAIALSSKNVVVPRLIPVINSSIPLFVESTSGALHEETIETHREIAAAIAEHDALRAQDAMYLHLFYNRKRILLTEKIPDLSDSIRKGCCPIFQKSVFTVFSKYIFIGKISPGNSSFQGFLRGATRI